MEVCREIECSPLPKSKLRVELSLPWTGCLTVRVPGRGGLCCPRLRKLSSTRWELSRGHSFVCGDAESRSSACDRSCGFAEVASVPEGVDGVHRQRGAWSAWASVLAGREL